MRLRSLFVAMMVVCSALFVCLISGCGGGGGSSPTDSKDDGSTTTSWTILVFMNADNDLEEYGILNLNQMEQVGSSSRVKIVVQMDRIGGATTDTSNSDWTGCRRYLVTRDTDSRLIRSTLLQDMGEIDMGNPGVLRDFIAWGEQNYPADHYCVVVWNHGSGWRSTSSLSTSRNVSFDDTSGTSIRTVDLPYALSGASAPIDLVAFDASLMQMLEVAYEIRNDALYMVGSEESPPGEGYNYDDWLHALYSNPGMTAPQLGRSISDNFVANYTGRTYVTQSVVNLSAVPTLAAAVDQLGTAIRPHAVTQAGALAAARQTAQSYKFSFYKDLLDYSVKVKNTLSDPAVTAACTQVQSALSQAVVYETHTGAQVSGSHGLSIYVPTPVEYVNLYSNLSINQDYPNWDTWLRAQRE